MILRSIRPTTRTVDGIQIVTCPEGAYYVGDPCYGASDGRWDAWLKDSDYFRRPLARDLGAWAVAFGTAYGDGTYTDNEGREYGVDAGLLGVIPVNFAGGSTSLHGMWRIEFPKPFDCWVEDGVVHLGHIIIDTTDSSIEEEQDDYYGDSGEDDEYEDGEV